MIMVNLNHPCYELDVWVCETKQEVRDSIGQGYTPIEWIRRVTVDQMASELAMLAEDVPDFVMIPKGTLVEVVGRDGDTLDVEFYVPNWIGAAGCYIPENETESVTAAQLLGNSGQEG